MGDLESYPRDELFNLLGIRQPRKSTVRREYFLKKPGPPPDLNAIPAAQGRPKVNRLGKAQAKNAYEAEQAIKADIQKPRRAEPGRALPRRNGGWWRSMKDVSDGQ